MHAYVKQHLEAYLHANNPQHTVHVECCLLTLLLDDNEAKFGDIINLSMSDVHALIRDRQTIITTKTCPKPLDLFVTMIHCFSSIILPYNGPRYEFSSNCLVSKNPEVPRLAFTARGQKIDPLLTQSAMHHNSFASTKLYVTNQILNYTSVTKDFLNYMQK
ncbi:hypothetical protein PR048_031945, partial [Dryococelus australis]